MKIFPKYLTQDELRRFFDAIASPRDRTLFGLIYHYGLRVDEATAITIQDVDLKHHRIRIRRLKNGIGGEKPLWRHTTKLLRVYLRVRKDAGPYLFTGREGPLKKPMVQNLFDEDPGCHGGVCHRADHFRAPLGVVHEVELALSKVIRRCQRIHLHAHEKIGAYYSRRLRLGVRHYQLLQVAYDRLQNGEVRGER